MRTGLGLKRDNVFRLTIALLTICYWGFVDAVSFMRLSQIFFIAVCVYNIIRKHKGRLRVFDQTYIKWGALWVGLCFISVLWSVDKDSTLAYTLSVFQVVLIGILATSQIKNEDTLDFLERLFIFAGVVLSLRLFIVTPTSSWGTSRFGTAIGMHENTIAVNLLISEFLAIKRFMTVGKSEHVLKKTYYILSVLVFCVVIFLTASRKAAILMIVGPALMLLFNGEKVSKKAKYVAIVLVAVVIFFNIVDYLPINFDFATRRIESIFDSLQGNGVIDASARERQYLMLTAFNTFSNHPILGVGLNCSRVFNTVHLYAHDNYLEILADLGIVGFVVYYSLYWVIIKKCWKGRRKSKDLRLYLPLMLTLLVLEISQITYFMESFQLFLAVMWYQTAWIYRTSGTVEETK